MDILEWKKKNELPVGYTHFDKKIGLKSTWNYVTDPKKVSQHSFYPFIHYDQEFYKFSKKDGKNQVTCKKRPICYSAHIDRCIYKYYGFLLNEKYNEYALNNGIDDCVIAYRTNRAKNDNNNIYFAKKAFDFIKKGDCSIMVGDFTSFFDTLEHIYLKKMLRKVLNVSSLPDDWYTVFKNVTKYSIWKLVELLKLNNLKDTYRDKKEFNSKELALKKEDFKKLKGKYIKTNRKKLGIPQGSAISGVLSNVHMIEFDQRISDIISSDGIYMRYSDDFIIIVPKNEKNEFKKIKEYVHNVVNQIDGLTLQSNKTQIFSFENSSIVNCTNQYQEEGENGNDYIDYLGFVFDGKMVTLRDKTISKYYTRMYKKLKYIIKCNGVSKYGNKISYKNLYIRYTQKGINVKNKSNNSKSKGNFLTYVKRAERIFGEENEGITLSTKRHMLKIRRKRDKLKNYYTI